MNPDELERLEAAATGGGWRVAEGVVRGSIHVTLPNGAIIGVAHDIEVPADAALIVALRNEAPTLIAAVRAVERVRELHVPAPPPLGAGSICNECTGTARKYVYHPCPTIRALDGE